ncbi:phosphoenolpyruvate synthase [Candidatus Kaiserbacteria bacterium RIFCSPHIGHO2_02_FULL_59_21]|uniref:Phosphoenolpyruvate synthase n=1 Tax=Candidatus Kaiserbacteria bacterium RIFCSPHIGHO2_02_FULL_59_21 TaxID=1798500 RepID=A0A1F6E0Z6_9BACT|nr:MAG: phosphoenolpyruvate synthase [Candidatus Kaiserbacteria bacterium RIFCSPHIGHO2_01_FULL_58_22]OGG66902.1 MAG: phosphoenolpyruvate synthase [Candidatus Kaiserbacteria bacterium RIFCSPHIGHO2_02_FULL_59_21]OGG80581.1 MAG: phosphoenolpyruvate synthase [Candidatus Kaiserbacteria bacterium RIFCSPLOWO2_01_FULL_59_34]OGG85478.1 MAG: phosphoenolpyruvate synthase [Candidatus Kaiserbacteria bacterium RIFCSPLOWO2_02_FULL_59_19]
MKAGRYVIRMEDAGMDDLALVGGKNASLGEMLRELSSKGIRVPTGFVVTAEAYRLFIREAGLDDFIRSSLESLEHGDLRSLESVSAEVRARIKSAPMPPAMEAQIAAGYRIMEKRYGRNIDVAIRSSATAEDLPDASFAGEHDTYLGVRGEKDVVRSVKSCFASLFTARAINYRLDKGFDHFSVALSVAIQRMVATHRGASGVMFTIDTETGFRDLVLINGAWGLGEMVVQGRVVPDEFLVAKKMLGTAPNPVIGKRLGGKHEKMVYSSKGSVGPTTIVKTSAAERNSFVLSDTQALQLANWAKAIEEHYSKKRGTYSPMDIEWGLDGKTGELFILQARPETVQVWKDRGRIREYVRLEDGEVLAKGLSVGNKIVSGVARVIGSVEDMEDLKPGEILITEMTDPDWEPVMKKAGAIVTDKGGRTSHAAIVSRELGLTAIVGAETVTKRLKTGQVITVDTTSAEGVIFKGALRFDVREHAIAKIPRTRTKMTMNLATPDTAFEKSFLPQSGVGLAREEFIIAASVGVHPLALLHYDKLDPRMRRKVDERTRGWSDRTNYYVDNLAYGIAKIATAFYPKQVIVRFSDFKSNEYRSLLGGELFEPHEENPMLGWRGASRYYDPKFKQAFALECLALRKVREEMGLDNAVPMVPFCRTLEEGRKVLAAMKEAGLIPRLLARTAKEKKAATKVIVMCEIPSNAILADEFLDIFDGMSIGSNDLTQLTLGLDRDSGIVNRVADENDEAVKKLIAGVIKVCTRRKKYVGICGQAPSDHPSFAKFLVEQGIESMSLNPDSIIKTTIAVAKAEKEMRKKKRKGNA